MGALSVRGRLLLGDTLVPGTIVAQDGRIARIVRDERDERDDPTPGPVLDAAIVAPGFVDLQVNGGFGVEVGEDADALRRLSACLPQTGVTSYLPTVISSPADFYPRLFAAFAAARRDATGANPLGLHLEGPFLSPARQGAHSRAIIEGSDPSLFETFLREDAVRLVTVAADRPDALPWIPRLCERGILVSIGHTDASYEQFARAVDAGARMATHLYNAMSPYEHRAPGAIGAALVDDRVATGLIADGIHSHIGAVRLALKAKGADRVALVTDLISAAGMPPGTYALGGEAVVVDETSARRRDGTLAGSMLTLDQAVRNVVQWTGAAPAQALRMAAEVPACLLGLDRIGRIVVGADADLVLLDEGLRVEGTIIGGEVVYRRART